MVRSLDDDASPAGVPSPSGGAPRSSPATDVVLACLTLGWTALAVHLFFLPDPEDLARSVHPSLGHAVVFGALGATAMAQFRPQGPRRTGRLFAVGVLAGVAVEVAQGLLTSNRGAQVGDVVADAIGLALGMAVPGLAYRTIPRPRLVTGVTAVGSALLLVALTTTVVIGPGGLSAWWSCRGQDSPASSPLLHVAADDITMAGDEEAAASLRRQLAPLRDDGTGPGDAAGYRFDGDDRVGLDRALPVACALREAGAFTVVAHLRDLPPTQEGPARILTISDGVRPHQIDLHLALIGNGASVRLRTAAGRLHHARIPDLVDGQPLELTLRYDGQVLELRVGGRTVHREAVDANSSTWRAGLPLTIGNEHTGDRGLQGTLTRLDLYAGVGGDGPA